MAKDVLYESHNCYEGHVSTDTLLSGGFMGRVHHSVEINTHLGLFDKNGVVKTDKVMSFMDISRVELASAFGLTSDQLRPEKIASRTRDTIGELAETIEYVAGIFKGSEEKTCKWFNLPNVHFGGSTPKKIILDGRFHKIKSFIYTSQKR